MNKKLGFAVLLVIGVLALPALAVINNPLDSSAFAFKYEGDNPASGFGNTGYNGGTTGYTLNSDGNLLDVAIDGGHGTPGLIVYLGSPTWTANATHANGWTWEADFKLASGRFTMRIGDESDAHDILDILVDGRVFSRINGLLTTIGDMSVSHTYRIAQAPNSDEYNVWIDNGFVDAFNAADTGIGAGGPHWWSDGSGSTSGEYQLDYVRFDANGYSPIPEPMTLALLGLGSTFMLRRKRQ